MKMSLLVESESAFLQAGVLNKCSCMDLKRVSRFGLELEMDLLRSLETMSSCITAQ